MGEISMEERERITKALAVPFPPQAIKKRAGRGGGSFDYVEGFTVIRRLNETTGNNWSLEILRLWTEERTMFAHVRLTIPGLGAREHIGIQENGAGDLAKGCVTDALKKAATLFGVALELYGPDYEAEDFRPSQATAKASAARDPQPAAPASAAAPNGKGVAENDREKIGRLAHFVWGEAWKAEIKEFAAARKIPYDAAHSAELVKALEERAGEGIGQSAS